MFNHVATRNAVCVAGLIASAVLCPARATTFSASVAASSYQGNGAQTKVQLDPGPGGSGSLGAEDGVVPSNKSTLAWDIRAPSYSFSAYAITDHNIAGLAEGSLEMTGVTPLILSPDWGTQPIPVTLKLTLSGGESGGYDWSTGFYENGVFAGIDDVGTTQYRTAGTVAFSTNCIYGTVQAPIPGLCLQEDVSFTISETVLISAGDPLLTVQTYLNYETLGTGTLNIDPVLTVTLPDGVQLAPEPGGMFSELNSSPGGTVPEPGTLALMAAGLALLIPVRGRRSSADT